MNPADGLPAEGDVCVRIWISDMVFEYLVAAAAVRNLLDDWKRRHWCTVELISEATDDSRSMARLPCERLFLGP